MLQNNLRCEENNHAQGAVKIVKMTATPTTFKSCPVQGCKKDRYWDFGWYKMVTAATDTVFGRFQGVNKNHMKNTVTAATKRPYGHELLSFFFVTSLLLLLPL